MKCHYDDKEFGRIMFFFRRDAKAMKFGWKNGAPQMVVPYGVPPNEVLNMIDANREKIRQLNRDDGVTFSDGQVIPCFRSTITISKDPRLRDQITYGQSRDDISSMYVRLPANVDFANAMVKRGISSVVSKLLAGAALRTLIPYAWAEAERLGLHPLRFEIGRGKRKLGHCTSEGVIQLSRFLMLMPEPLVQCVVCHELAHLTHLEHSPQFYALLDTYLDGRRAALDKQIDHFPWPIIR